MSIQEGNKRRFQIRDSTHPNVEGVIEPIELLDVDGNPILTAGGGGGGAFSVVLNMSFLGAANPTFDELTNTTGATISVVRSAAGTYAIIFDQAIIPNGAAVVTTFLTTTTNTILKSNAVSDSAIIIRNYDSSFTEVDLAVFDRVSVSIAPN